MSCRTILFVPANRPERYEKAMASGADKICIDLEDAVPLAQKDTARATLLNFLGERGSLGTLAGISIRINPIQTPAGLRDILALVKLEHLPPVLLLPKIRHQREVQMLREILSEKHAKLSLAAILESPEGIANAVTIGAEPSVDYLMFGSADWSTECGCSMRWDSLLTPRSQIVQAAAQTGTTAIDGAWLALDDIDGLIDETCRTAELGFGGRVLLHPKQVVPAHQAYQPEEAAVQHAQRIVAACADSVEGVIVVDGRMVDAPILNAAQRILSLAGLATHY